MRLIILAAVLLLGVSVISSVSGAEDTDSKSPAKKTLILATTTSVENTGLIYNLTGPFEEMFDIKVDVIAVGSGKAIEMGEKGEADLVLVHSPELENEFIANGYGINKRNVMQNDFVIAGPRNDTADISKVTPAEAFKKIAASKSPFISRGDKSGTHQKEQQIWKEAGINPEGAWYVQTGKGMGSTLQIANDKNAYCLTDRGTFLAMESDDKESGIDIVILNEGDDSLYNPYSIIAVNPARYPEVNYVEAMTFIGWVTSPQGQRIIGELKKNGNVLFNPSALK